MRGVTNMEKYEIVSFIPARGSSTRIPRKNIRMMAGKPMIAWIIEASLGSKYIDRTIVSTEDKEIKRVALKFGAEVIDRPAEFSEGEITLNFALSDFKYKLWKEGYQPNYIIFLHATSPLVTGRHIDEAFDFYFKSESTVLLSVTETYPKPPSTYFINGSGRLENLLKKSIIRVLNKKFGIDSIGTPTIYHESGAICIGPYRGIDYPTSHYVDYVLPYIMSPEDSIDVDTPFDFKVAEMLLEERIKGRSKND